MQAVPEGRSIIRIIEKSICTFDISRNEVSRVVDLRNANALADFGFGCDVMLGSDYLELVEEFD